MGIRTGGGFGSRWIVFGGLCWGVWRLGGCVGCGGWCIIGWCCWVRGWPHRMPISMPPVNKSTPAPTYYPHTVPPHISSPNSNPQSPIDTPQPASYSTPDSVPINSVHWVFSLYRLVLVIIGIIMWVSGIGWIDEVGVVGIGFTRWSSLGRCLWLGLFFGGRLLCCFILSWNCCIVSICHCSHSCMTPISTTP